MLRNGFKLFSVWRHGTLPQYFSSWYVCDADDSTQFMMSRYDMFWLRRSLMLRYVFYRIQYDTRRDEIDETDEKVKFLVISRSRVIIRCDMVRFCGQKCSTIQYDPLKHVTRVRYITLHIMQAIPYGVQT